MLKEKWKSKPKSNQIIKAKEINTSNKKDSTNNKEVVIRNMNKTAEAQMQQPTQGQQKSIRISEDVDLLHNPLSKPSYKLKKFWSFAFFILFENV